MKFRDDIDLVFSILILSWSLLPYIAMAIGMVMAFGKKDAKQ